MAMRMLIVFLVLITAVCPGQEAEPVSGKPSAADSSQPRQDGLSALTSGPGVLFQKVERGIISGDLDALAPSLGKQVSMTIRGNESGYFSAAQALTILKNYFSSRKALQFSFNRINETAAYPYATGRLDYGVRGSKESVQVYVSLARQDTVWVISQFNIY